MSVSPVWRNANIAGQQLAQFFFGDLGGQDLTRRFVIDQGVPHRGECPVRQPFLGGQQSAPVGQFGDLFAATAAVGVKGDPSAHRGSARRWREVSPSQWSSRCGTLLPGIRVGKIGNDMASNKRRRHTPDQVIRKLAEGNKLLASGQELDLVCRHLEVAESTWHRWLAQYGGMKAGDVKPLKELEAEYARLKKLVAN